MVNTQSLTSSEFCNFTQVNFNTKIWFFKNNFINQGVTCLKLSNISPYCLITSTDANLHRNEDKVISQSFKYRIYLFMANQNASQVQDHCRFHEGHLKLNFSHPKLGLFGYYSMDSMSG